MQGIREGIRRNGRFLNRGLESSFIGNRNAERGFRQNGIPEAMCRIDGKAAQRLIGQGFFQRFAVFIRGNMPHDNAQAGVVPLRLERFLNAAVRGRVGARYPVWMHYPSLRTVLAPFDAHGSHGCLLALARQ